MQIVGIDVGRDHVKVITRNGKLKFKSLVGEWRERRLTAGGDYEVEINGEKYFVADLAEESYACREMATESKLHEETKILFLTAVALSADPGQGIRINTGLPVNQHTPDIKDKMKHLLRGEHHIRVGNREGRYLIEHIDIVPESGGTYWDSVLNLNGEVVNPWLAKNVVRVVDIGSRTVNYCTVKERKYLDRDSGTLNYGMMEIENAGGEDAEKEIIAQFARRVAGDLARRWLGYKPNKDIILLAGGGSLLLKNYFKEHFNAVQTVEDPVYSNASGFYKMGVVKYAAENKKHVL